LIANDPDYKNMPDEEIDMKLNHFPVDLTAYIKIWQSISLRYKAKIEDRWLGGVVRAIENLVYKEFDLKVSTKGYTEK
jgi:hypothetical protein